LNAPYLETTALDVSIGGKSVCRGLGIQLRPGEVWAVLGENGVGKSTLMATLAGVRGAQCGEIRLHDEVLQHLSRRERARRLAWLAQQDDDAFPSTVLEQVLVGRHPYLDRLAWESAEDEAIARAALRAVDLPGIEHRDVTTLSGGERRRVALAAILAQQTSLLLLDEPLAQIDVRHQAAVLQLLSSLAQQQKTVMLITHDPNQAVRAASHVLLLFGEGRTLAGPAREVLSADNLSSLYRCPIGEIRQDGAVYFSVVGPSIAGT
jgi:iron complex transport system ATP-binding protein